MLWSGRCGNTSKNLQTAERLHDSASGGLPMPKIERVLIVGAGIAGLSLAIALKRQGLNPEIVERQAALPTYGAGIYLVGNAMRALRSLNLDDRVLRQSSLIQTQTLLNDRGRKRMALRKAETLMY